MIGQSVYESKWCYDIGPKNVGYKFINAEATKDNYYTSSILKNISHDLRLAAIVVNISPLLKKIFGSSIIYEENYGTPQRESDNSTNIKNVTDMYNFLISKNVDKISSVSAEDKSIGTIVVNMTKILCEKKMTFLPL